uniref:Antimicrobial peptide type 1 Ie n=1 Tax=Pandalus japonicus TaxID=666362 RepID=T1W3L6_PANJP|nr:antimicrobial peptide type 1 precursor Ie [Pandalus japonicus]
MVNRAMSLVFLVGLIACASALSSIPPPPPLPPTCLQHCEESFGKYICCDEHLGKCPAVRPICPSGLRKGFEPQFCQHDGHCADHQKCCYDVCLPAGKKVCKPAFY